MRDGSTGVRIGLDYRPAMRATTGIGRYVSGLSGALARQGCDLRLFGIFFRGNRPALRHAPAGARLVAWKVPTRTVNLLAALGLSSADRLVGGCDLFHHTNFLLVPVRARVPQVMTLHDLAFLRDPSFHAPRAAAAMEEVVRRAARVCAAFCVPSEATANDAERLLGIPRERIVVTPLGVDPSYFELPRRETRRRSLLCVGTLEPRKNHARLIRAFARAGVDAELLVAGQRGWLCDEVVEEARRTPHVRLLGHRPEAELRSLLAGAHAVVYPSLLEGFGLPVLEAMAAGRPVLTSDREPLRSLAGDAALLVDPEDEEALAEGIQRVVEDETLRAELSRRGPERARTFTWERCAEQTLRAYEAALS